MPFFFFLGRNIWTWFIPVSATKQISVSVGWMYGSLGYLLASWQWGGGVREASRPWAATQSWGRTGQSLGSDPMSSSTCKWRCMVGTRHWNDSVPMFPPLPAFARVSQFSMVERRATLLSQYPSLVLRLCVFWAVRKLGAEKFQNRLYWLKRTTTITSFFFLFF